MVRSWDSRSRWGRPLPEGPRPASDRSQPRSRSHRGVTRESPGTHWEVSHGAESAWTKSGMHSGMPLSLHCAGAGGRPAATRSPVVGWPPRVALTYTLEVQLGSFLDFATMHARSPGLTLPAALSAVVLVAACGGRDAGSGGNWQFKVDTTRSEADSGVREASWPRVTGKERPEGAAGTNGVHLRFGAFP